MRKLKTSLFLLLASSMLVLARTFYVDGTGGDDAHDGLTAATPWKTLAQATKHLKAGDTLSIAPGTYYESLLFHASGTPTHPIVVQGNGAVISGRRPVPADSWQALPGGLFLSPNAIYSPVNRPHVLDRDGQRIDIPQAEPASLKPGQAMWTADGIIYRPTPGKTPQQDNLSGFYLISGCVISNRSYITVHNLVCENFANDGFNVHGNCRGLLFHNITARHNGDDGFSVHEDVQSTVHGGHFHHNNFGIQDINISRSSYCGLLVEDNRIVGADFSGGFHALEDSLVRRNALAQIRLSSSHAEHLGLRRHAPLLNGTAFLRNVLVSEGAGQAVVLGANSQLTAIACTFLNTDYGVHLERQANLQLMQSVIAHTRRDAVVVSDTSAHVAIDSSVLSPATARLGQRQLSGEAMLAALACRDCSVQPPVLRDDYRTRAPRLSRGKHQVAPGFNPPCRLAFVPPAPAHFTTSTQPNPELKFDFETVNPWCRTYLEPEKRERAAQHRSTLDDSCAAQGKSSAKVEVSLPPGAASRQVQLKLFTEKLNDFTSAPVHWSFYLKPDVSAQGVRYVLRIRDAEGEQHYGPSGVMDWTGWRQIQWDMRQQPARVAGAGNRRLDTPPLELVLEVMVDVPPEGRNLHFHVDDLMIK